MAGKRFALTEGGPKDLDVRWSTGWRKLRIEYQGVPVLEVATQKQLKAGVEGTLPDGRVLSARLAKKGLGSDLELLVEGRPVPGSAFDPKAMLRGAYGIIFFLAGLNTVLGLVAVLADVRFLQAIGLGWISIIFGVVLGGLGVLVMRRSRTALAIAIGLMALDMLLLIASFGSMETPPVGAVVVRLLFIAGMARGFPAIRRMEELESLEMRTQAFD